MTTPAAHPPQPAAGDAPDPASDPAAVLALYDSQERAAQQPARAGEQVERFGATVRTTSGTGPGFVTAVGLEAADLDAAIAEHVTHFRALDAGAGREFEWKVYGHDTPPDLAERLAAAGFVPEEVEAFVVGSVPAVLAATEGAEPPAGVRVREVLEATLDTDAERIAEHHHEVWGRSFDWMAQMLRDEKRHDPAALRIHLAETTGADGGPAGRVVCAAWLRFPSGSSFAGLWGGSTSPDWRGRGLYRALVRIRAQQAAAAGVALLQVDASPDSRPILERLGFVVLDWTRPYQWTP